MDITTDQAEQLLSTDGGWVKYFRERFQTVASSSLFWHSFIRDILVNQRTSTVSLGDWAISPTLDIDSIIKGIREILDTPAVSGGVPWRTVAQRKPYPLTMHDTKNKMNQYWHYILVHPTGGIVVRGAVGVAFEVDITSTNGELVDKLATYLRNADAQAQKVERAGIEILTSTPHGLALKTQPNMGTPLTRANYSADVLQAYDQIVELLPGGARGRLVIFEGPPGTGKTHLVRALLSDLSEQVCSIFIPANMAGQLGNPELLTLLTTTAERVQKPLMLVMEDADEAITRRGVDNMSRVTTILGLTDGILADITNVRIVVTTNARKVETDAATTRAARILSRVHVPRLKEKHARERFAAIHGEEAVYPFGSREVHLGEVYLGEPDDSTENKRVGFGD